mmetsp:Transcript_9264/g.10178  ORF Transcript_9264/g.10178 Transcript_9264/m.10178 type:complete len:84 (+) Transcript_9264:250-501(+)
MRYDYKSNQKGYKTSQFMVFFSPVFNKLSLEKSTWSKVDNHTCLETISACPYGSSECLFRSMIIAIQHNEAMQMIWGLEKNID